MITAEDIIKLINFVIGVTLAMVGTALLGFFHRAFWQTLVGRWLGNAAHTGFVYRSHRKKPYSKNKRTNTERKAASTAAKVVFNERCKDGGYKIYKTVEDAEGVTLLNCLAYRK